MSAPHVIIDQYELAARMLEMILQSPRPPGMRAEELVQGFSDDRLRNQVMNLAEISARYFQEVFVVAMEQSEKHARAQSAALGGGSGCE